MRPPPNCNARGITVSHPGASLCAFPDTETDAMDLFRSPGIAPPPLPNFTSGLAWARRYGHVRHLREPDVGAANEDDAPQGVDQDFEEYDFE